MSSLSYYYCLVGVYKVLISSKLDDSVLY